MNKPCLGLLDQYADFQRRIDLETIQNYLHLYPTPQRKKYVDVEDDANGNMTSDGKYCYEFNEANQMSKVKECGNSQTISEYVYDYNGLRMVKKNYQHGSLKDTVTSWSDSFETKVIVGGATENTSYYFANNELIAKKDNSGTRTYYHNDHLGSATLLTNSGGTLVEDTKFDPWGEVKSGGTKSKFLYTGQEKDLETGLNYYNARYYDSHIRRFTQPDDIIQEIFDPQTLNRYSYVRNNPLRYTDPTGHAFSDDTGGASPVIPAFDSITDKFDSGDYLGGAWDSSTYIPVAGEGKIAVVGSLKLMNAEKFLPAVKNLTKYDKIASSQVVQKTVQVGTQKIADTKQFIVNGNNVLRVGSPKQGAPFRIGIGPAPKPHYEKLNTVQKILSPIHIHIEKKKIGIDFNWFKKAFYKKW